MHVQPANLLFLPVVIHVERPVDREPTSLGKVCVISQQRARVGPIDGVIVHCRWLIDMKMFSRAL